MDRQLNSDILCEILNAINAHTATLILQKVKSHRGVEMNELADQHAGAAASASDSDIDTLLEQPVGLNPFTYNWTPPLSWPGH
eukprot:1053052-Rhodomonas_salina.1